MTMKSKQNSDRMNNFFSGVAIILSLLAGIMGAFSVFKIASVEQQVEALNRAVTNQQQAQLTLSQGRTAETASSQSPDSATSETSQSLIIMSLAFNQVNLFSLLWKVGQR
jgi:predicted PurR-regulated permease PerM